MQPFEIITFDCYGTLIDWESGIRDAFRGAGGDALPGIDVIPAYAKAEAAVEREGWRPYREVLTAAAARTVAELQLPQPASSDFLVRSLPAWRPFPDTNEALDRMKRAGIALGILSNVDDDLLAATRRHFPVEFDFVVTAEQVRSYKPAAAHFLAARDAIGNRRWLHAAQSSFHDIVPANALGIPTAWINRKSMRPLPGGEPVMEFATLEELADALTRSTSS